MCSRYLPFLQQLLADYSLSSVIILIKLFFPEHGTGCAEHGTAYACHGAVANV